MQIDNFHLTYCTNIHPGEQWSQVFANLQEYIPQLQSQLASHQPFGIGLRLANIATEELLISDNLNKFKQWLNTHNLYVFTLNGFPYGGFHQQVVKDQVYAPDWSKLERLEYSLRLINILAELLPQGMAGSISTLPLSYKPWFRNQHNARIHLEQNLLQATIHITQAVEQMVLVRDRTGKFLHLALEPEPDGLLENAEEVIDYFQKYLLPIGGEYLAKRLGISPQFAENLLLEHVQVCYDTCHFAVEYENPFLAIQKLHAAGIKIGKVQVSAALKVNLPKEKKQRDIIKSKLQSFVESTYLHQVITKNSNGNLQNYIDLEIALSEFEYSDAEEWRIHFHVPIFIANYGILESTQDDIITVLDLLKIYKFCNCLEIETYTWEVLPSAIKLDLIPSIQREYEWLLTKLSDVNTEIIS
jgi:hypothetical protein